ncbi:MAG: hypothetical protein V7640_1333 [Betaproteobacteria bacterium]|jgi:hypothetical protein
MDEFDPEVMDEEILSEDESDILPEEPITGEVRCGHGLMDILVPAVPPRPTNARLIRRLKD